MTRNDATVLPYHFVPVVPADRRTGDLPHGELLDPSHEGLHHHKFVAGRRSGRILCRLTTVTPLVLGGERTERSGKPSKVEPFLLGGRPAIPGSSLRGMVSAVAEAASNSALRVLDDRVYSFRKIAPRALRSLGEVVVEGEGDDRRYFVREFTGWSKVAPLDRQGQPLESWRDGRRRFYGRERNAGKGAELMPWEQIPPAMRNRYERGIVRAMAAAGRDLPESRKHEIFIPYDPEKVRRWRKLPIRPAAVERFHELADERSRASETRDVPALPYAPVGRPRERAADPDDPTIRLADGDLIFFKEERGEAVEIAWSAIWRERVEDRQGRPLRAWSFFEGIDRDLVPFHAGRAGGGLTLAEQLFGFVSEDDAPSEHDPTPALASRVRVSFGRLEGNGDGAFLEPCTLRILASPKPPSPSLYFSDFEDPGAYVAKHELDPARHRPRGRKFYVHQLWDPDSDPATWPWRSQDESDRPELKSEVEPLRHGLSFVFHLDYDNLSDAELALLLYALRPTAGFRHKLGMGKPVGLGSVRVDVLGVFEVDRGRRYRRQGLFAPRYARAAVASEIADLGERYRHELAAAEAASSGDEIEELRRSWRRGMDSEVRDALERLGEEAFDPEEVSVPRVVEAEDPESETFKWFVTYEKGRRRGEALAEIGPPGTPWPRLRILPEWQGSAKPPRRGKPRHHRGRHRGPRR